MNNYLTIAEAAEKLEVSRQRVWVLIETYGIEPKRIGRMAVLLPSQVTRLDKARKKNEKFKAKG